MNRSFLYGIVVLMIMMLSGCGYNTIQQKDEAVKAAWGDVEASYQRRNDLVPNLVEAVKAYAKHESETLEAVTEARARVGSVQVSKDTLNDPQVMAQFQQAQANMSGALSHLL